MTHLTTSDRAVTPHAFTTFPSTVSDIDVILMPTSEKGKTLSARQLSWEDQGRIPAEDNFFASSGAGWAVPGGSPFPSNQPLVQKTAPIRIVLVDDHMLVREGIRSVLT